MVRVSVTMPAYNAAQYIGAAIESVLAQTWKDFELIVVDDGSTDQTPSILSRYSDQRLVVIRQRNGGEAVARNTALDHARGEYVAFLDADDLYLPTALALMVGYLDAHGEAGAVYTDGYLCDAEGNPLLRLSEHRPAHHVGHILEPLILNPSVIGGVLYTMIRRKVIEARGLRFDPALRIGPDWDFLIQVARFAAFGYVDRPTYLYRIHQTNVTRITPRSRRTADLIRGRMKVLEADWFGDLSVPTRSAFLLSLLTDLAAGDPTLQRELLESAPFAALPAGERGRILRLTATTYLLSGSEIDFADDLLRRSLEAAPHDAKALLVSNLMAYSPRLATYLLNAWRLLCSGLRSARSVARRRPKPVPAALGPTHD